MEKLTPTEIENIARLLLSPDSKNIELAHALLEQNLYAIPQIINEISVFIFFNPMKTNLSDLVAKVLPNFSLKDNPAFIFTLQPLEELKRQIKAQEEGKIRIQWQALKMLAKQVWVMQDNHPYYHQRIELLHTLALIEWKGFQDADAAEEYLEQALEEFEGDTRTIQLGMDIFLEAQNTKKAIHWHEKMLAKTPFDIFVLMGIAGLHFQNKNFSKAKEYYLQIIDMADYSPAKEQLAAIDKIEKGMLDAQIIDHQDHLHGMEEKDLEEL